MAMTPSEVNVSLSQFEGVEVCGHRGYFLRGVGVKLNYALQQYAMDWLEKRNYTLLQTPFFMDKDVMAKTAQLEQFDEELYKVELLSGSLSSGCWQQR